MSEQTQQARQVAGRSFPYFAVVSLILLVAKLTGHFAYSWVFVFLPVFIPLLTFLLFIGLVLVATGLVLLVAYLIDAYQESKRKKRAKERAEQFKL